MTQDRRRVTWSARTRRMVALAAFAASGTFAAFAAIAPGSDSPLASPGTLSEKLALRFADRVLDPAASYLREERYGRGDTPDSLLARLGIAAEDVARLVRLRALGMLRPGHDARAELDAGGRLLLLEYLTGRDTVVAVRREGDTLRVSETPVQLFAYTTMRSGEIRSSLFAATDAAGIPDSVAMQLADIFSGEVDFHRDLRSGDRFSVVYDSYFFPGGPGQAGRVLAAEFVSPAKSLRAVYYAGGQNGRGAGYYAPDGRNLRKAFLRSPLEFSRVTSGFGMRIDPFRATWRAHTGVDYGAPTGTRVRAVSDAVVEFVGTKGGYGTAVVLRHQGRYSTLYGHLSRVARGLGRGMRVAQGEVIGYVGQTGWATGPHLHYEFRIDGEARNPLAMILPSGQPVPRQEKAQFLQSTQPLVAKLDLLAHGELALLE